MGKLSNSSEKPRKIVRIPNYPRLAGAGIAITLAASCDGVFSIEASHDGAMVPPLVEKENKPGNENVAVQDSGSQNASPKVPIALPSADPGRDGSVSTSSPSVKDTGKQGVPSASTVQKPKRNIATLGSIESPFEPTE